MIWQAVHIVKKYFAGDATSEAKDGVAPESSQDGSLREMQQ